MKLLFCNPGLWRARLRVVLCQVRPGVGLWQDGPGVGFRQHRPRVVRLGDILVIFEVLCHIFVTVGHSSGVKTPPQYILNRVVGASIQ